MVSNCTLRIVLDGTIFVIRLESSLSTSAVDHTNQASKTELNGLLKSHAELLGNIERLQGIKLENNTLIIARSTLSYNSVFMLSK